MNDEEKEQKVTELRSEIRALKEKYANIRAGYVIFGALFVVGIPLVMLSLPLGAIESFAKIFDKDVDGFTDTLGYIVLGTVLITFGIASNHLSRVDKQIEDLHLKVSEMALSFSNPEFKFKPENHELEKLPEYEQELERLEALDNRKNNKVLKAAGCLNRAVGLVSIILFIIFWEMMNSASVGYGAILLFPLLLITGLFSFFYLMSLIPRFKKRMQGSEGNLEELREKVAILKSYKSEKVVETNQLLQQSEISNADLSWCHDRQKYYKRNLFLTAGVIWAVLSYLLFGGAVWSFVTLQSGISSADMLSLLLLWFIYKNVKTYFELAYQADVKKRVFPIICKTLGMEYSSSPVFSPEDVAKHGIMPAHKYFYVDDAFRGQHNGRAIEFQEFISSRYSLNYLEEGRARGPISRLKMAAIGPKAFLWKAKNEKGYARGVAARIPLNKKLHFQTIAGTQKHRDFTAYSKLKDVSLLSPELKHRYNILTSDQMEARQIFDPAFMERFVLLADHLGGEKFVASFHGEELLIIILSDLDYFDVGDLDKPLSFDCFEPLVRHTKAYQEIIDLLDL